MKESRIRGDRSRARRVRQLRMRISITVLTVGMVIAGSLLIGRLQLSAKADASVPSYKYYKSIMVCYGDTLSGIADKMNIPDYETADYILEVMNINSLSDEEDIRAGEYLVVPYYSDEVLG